jgi:Uma2 family endonuclease
MPSEPTLVATLILDPDTERRVLNRRRAAGLDGRDEVWDGTYVMSPLADFEHQQIVGEFQAILQTVIGWAGLGAVVPGVNISDREDDWTRNYRIPDVAVFLANTTARNRGSHWLGGPDLVIEVLSPGDRIDEKRAFYARVATRELLVIDRDPWALTLFQLADGDLRAVGASTADRPEPLPLLATVGLSVRLEAVPDATRPRIIVTHPDGRRWAF